jgi:uncharacterized protein YjiS (DUF1127 family)
MLLSIVMNKLRIWRAYRETVYQLESLADRELSDLGIGRRDIKRLARDATQPARQKLEGSAERIGLRLSADHPAR